MKIAGVDIADAYSEAFAAAYCRVLVTAADSYWLQHAARAATGLATSIIGCDVEAGVETFTRDTPDGRPGANLLFFSRKAETMEKSLILRIGQGLMTCPSTAVFSGLSNGTPIRPGYKLRFFGDGFEKGGEIGGRRGWIIPVTEGEFFTEDTFRIAEGVAGGAFLIMAESNDAALTAARKAFEAIEPLPGVITPFPGGAARCASKVGSGKYSFLKASTNTPFCPTLKESVNTKVPDSVNSILEIVVDGVDLSSVENAMRAGINAACGVDGVKMISAAEFGGKLGGIKIGPREILQRAT